MSKLSGTITQCTKPTHNSFGSRNNKRDGDLIFQHNINESTDGETYTVDAVLCLHSDGTFDYNLDGYCANDEMGSTLTNSIYGSWMVQEDNSSLLTLTPIYKHKYLSEGWEKIENETILKQVATTKNFDGKSVMAWDPRRCSDTITCFAYGKVEQTLFKQQ